MMARATTTSPSPSAGPEPPTASQPAPGQPGQPGLRDAAQATPKPGTSAGDADEIRTLVV